MKFTIRDLFLVTVIVALGLGWALDHFAVTAERQRLKIELAGSQERERLAIHSEEALSRSLDGAIPDWRRRVSESNKVDPSR